MKSRARRAAFLFTVLAISIATGCASLGAAYAPLERVPADKALVYVYRPSSFVGSAISYTVHAGERPIVKLYNGGYRAYLADPGETEFWAKTEARSSVTKQLEAGKTYYLRGTVSAGLMAGRPNLQWVDASEAGREISGCREVPQETN